MENPGGRMKTVESERLPGSPEQTEETELTDVKNSNRLQVPQAKEEELYVSHVTLLAAEKGERSHRGLRLHPRSKREAPTFPLYLFRNCMINLSLEIWICWFAFLLQIYFTVSSFFQETASDYVEATFKMRRCSAHIRANAQT